MNIIACFKWVVDEAYIRRTASGDLDFSSVDYKIGDYDRNAIEEAVRLKEVHGGSVIAATVGDPGAAKGIKDALSRGPDEGLFVCDEAFRELESSQTAALLADAVRRKPAHDLIICGEGSSDLYAQQVGPRLAGQLGIVCISFVRKLTVEGGRLIAEKKVDDGVEIVEAALPAVVTVLPEINVPRIPGVKDTLMASKKPVSKIERGELSSVPEPLLKTIGLTAPGLGRQCERFGTDEAEIARFVDALKKKGALA